MSGLARAAVPLPALEASAEERLHAVLATHDVAAIDEPSEDQWRVFFHDTSDRDAALTRLRDRLQELRFDAFDAADENWAARSQESLRAIKVGRIIVAPPWDSPISIVIRPSMGFGTGHHATTRLCLAALQALDVKERTVIDVGTGSGVLAIAASLLGAVNVRGIDDDEDAIHAAWDNLALNPAAIVSLLVGDLRATQFDPADIVFGNLTGGLLMASAPVISGLAGAHGRLILSGFQVPEESDVVAAFVGFTVERREQEDDWVCVTLKRRSV